MKVDLLKKLIKEAVAEAVQEELGKLLSEDVTPTKTQVQEVRKYQAYKPPVSRPIPTGNPIMDLMNETKHSMTQGEYRELVSATSDMVQAPGLGMNTVTENFNQGPEPGLDISQFDFMMRAGDVFKASVEKDKQRFGA
jgi:hypothetical protein